MNLAVSTTDHQLQFDSLLINYSKYSEMLHKKWLIGCNFLILNVRHFASDYQARVTLRFEF